jgi:hypothetical protein
MKKRVKNRVVKEKPKRKVGKWLYLSPRVLSILFIMFIAMFSLDEFGNNYTFWQLVLGLFMHNIPSFILIIFLVIAWKREWLGAVGFFLFAVWYVWFIFRNISGNGFEWYYLSWALTIAAPAFLVGILWWLNWKRKKR